MLLSHIVEAVMNSCTAAAGRFTVSGLSSLQAQLHSSKIKFNVPFAAGKVHKSQLLICMDCGEQPHPMQK